MKYPPCDPSSHEASSRFTETRQLQRLHVPKRTSSFFGALPLRMIFKLRITNRCRHFHCESECVDSAHQFTEVAALL